jgi:hypothetical protein
LALGITNNALPPIAAINGGFPVGGAKAFFDLRHRTQFFFHADKPRGRSETAVSPEISDPALDQLRSNH